MLKHHNFRRLLRAGSSAATITLAFTIFTGRGYAQTGAQNEPAPAGDKASIVSEVIVTGQKTALSALGNQKIVDTPFTIDAVQASTISNLQARSINDALQFYPALTPTKPDVTGFSQFSVRGFSTGNIFIDGLNYSASNFSLEPRLQLYDNVQLLEGASGFFYGFSPPGGIISYQSKRPTAAPFLETTVGFDSPSNYSSHIDASNSFADGKVGVRLNIFADDGAVETAHTNTSDVAIGLDTDIALTSTTKLELNGSYTNRFLNNVAYDIVPRYVGTAPEPISSSKQIGPDGSKVSDISEGLTGKIIQQLPSDWTFTLAGSYFHQRFIYNTEALSITDRAGTVSEYQYGNAKQGNVGSVQGVFAGNIQTGPIQHRIAFGGEYRQDDEDVGLTADGENDYIYNYIGDFNLRTGQPLSFAGFSRMNLSSTTPLYSETDKSVFLTDTMVFGQFRLTAGVRYVSIFTNDEYDVVTQTSDKVTPTVALSYKPTTNSSVYFSYAQSFEPGDQVSSQYINGGQVFAPVTSDQYEVGYKYEDSRMRLSASIFDIIRSGYEYVVYPSSDALLPLIANNGSQHHVGIEASADIHFTPWLEGMAGFQYVHATIEGVPADQAASHEPGIPKLGISGGIEVSPPMTPGLTLTASAFYNSSAYLEALDTFYVPGYAYGNLGGRYKFSCAKTYECLLRAELLNFTGERYWVIGGSNNFLQGQPREVRVSLTARF